jgi:hypothetical protein
MPENCAKIETMRKKGTKSSTKPVQTLPERIPLSEGQRKFLVGQVLFSAVGIFLLGMPAFFFAGMALGPSSGAKSVYFGLFATGSFGFAALVGWMGRKFLNDLRSGVVLNRRGKILELHARNGVVRQVEVEGIGMLDPLPGKKIAPFEKEPEAGKTFLVTYSPASGILWNLR